MPLYRKDLAEILKGGGQEAQALSTSQLSAQQAQQQQGLDKARTQQAIQSLSDLMGGSDQLKKRIDQGASINLGEGHAGFGMDPMLKLAQQGPKQAQSFLKTAQGAYKGINDQLDASKSTLDALNQGNAASDKLALISEARLAAGAGGSRAIKGIMDALTSGRTSGSDFQSALNYIQNTPNIPTLQPAQRDALRESVFSRLSQLQQMHGQASQQLMQQGPVVAPQADYSTLAKSYIEPASQKLSQLQQAQSEYAKQRASQQGSNVSQPGVANPNPTTLDKLKSLFTGGAAQAPSQSSDVAAKMQRLQELRAKQGSK